MSWLLTDSEFATAAEAVRRGNMTPPLYRFVGRLVATNVRSGIVSPTLSSAGIWSDEAIADAAHDWLVERLLRGGFLHAFDRTGSPQAFSRYLEISFRNWLRDRARSRSWPRILVRAREILESNDKFENLGGGGTWMDERWGLASWGNAASAADDPHVIRAVYAIPDLQLLRHAGHSGRAAPILSKPDLTRVLEGVLDKVQATVSLRQLDRGFRHRFAWAFQAADVGLDEAFEEQLSEEPSSEILARDQALSVLAELTERQLEMLRGRAEGMTLEELAEANGCSRGTADNELKRAGAVIRRALADDEFYEQSLEILLTLSFSERG